VKNTPIPGLQHPCAVAGCGALIRTSLLMCGRHWRQVPAKLRREVLDAYYRWQLGEVSLSDLRAVQDQAARAVEGGAR
jgi:hypothetical protein